MTFDVSGVRVTLDEVAVMPLTFKYDRPIAGLIGAPFLKQFVVRLDYAGGTTASPRPQAL